MPVYRTPDGRIVEERTEVTPPGDASARGRKRYDETTVVHRPGSGSRGDERTRLHGGIPPAGEKEADEIDPVTGWLVVIDGPGRGSDVRIGAGRNSLGRDRNGNRIALPFGDALISREKQLWITHDDRSQKFSIAPGGDSANVAYLNDEPIDTRLPLEDGATLEVGKTKLRFVAFCGSGFRWSDGDG